MSVIAAKVKKNFGTIQIAADSIILRGQTNRKYTKLIKVNEMILGGVGLAEEISLMFRYAQTHRPETPTERDVLAFMVDFLSWKKDYSGGNIENYYLLAYKGHLFVIEHRLVREVNDYEAIGAGEEYALAALYLGKTPEEAVKVACDLCCYVAEPIIKYDMNMEEMVE